MSKLSIFRRFTSKRCGAQFLSDNTINSRAYPRGYVDVAIDGITVENDSLYPLLKVF